MCHLLSSGIKCTLLPAIVLLLVTCGCTVQSPVSNRELSLAERAERAATRAEAAALSAKQDAERAERAAAKAERIFYKRLNK